MTYGMKFVNGEWQAAPVTDHGVVTARGLYLTLWEAMENANRLNRSCVR